MQWHEGPDGTDHPMANNPWGPKPGKGANGDKGDGGAGGGDSGGPASPDGNGPNPDGPRNPWTPPPGGKPQQRGPSLDEIFRKRAGGPGGSGGGRGPQMPKFDGKRFLPWAIGILLILWIVSTSVWRLGPEQQGVVTLFGSYTRTVGSGINLTLPFPIERLEKVDVTAIRETQIGKTGDADENLVLTGDQNIIDMAYQVRWTVRDPEQYLFQLADQEETVKAVAESAMRAAVANFKLTDAIGPGRSKIEAQVQQRMQAILNEYGAGIQIQSISILESDPPAEVKEAFRQVNAAQQQRESYLNDARAYAQQVLERARGDAAEFNDIYEEYRLAPGVTRTRLYYETMESVLQDADKTIIEPGNVVPYLPIPGAMQRTTPAQPQAKAPAPAKTDSEGGDQ